MPISFSSPTNRNPGGRGAGVTAVLGPTNTGKTHLAIERMLAHSSGIIGLPLRLLAREVYNKIADRAGPDAVALVTGEEKIKPANPRFWVSTVEAMPRDLDVAFVAIDEVQLGADLERGHVFTDRILNRRGRDETLVLGAQTVRPMVERLLPGAHVLTRPRLSQLSFSGEKKITRLPRRSAVVAFSAEEVYSIAELIRRQRGGAAVVLGSLSPRTRNSQVALYQSGDVEYLVATDAIGMGLNLDVDHVAFASDRKFDGYQFRKLNPAELAQIAGRAGRATRNGSFGTTGRCPPFETELAQALESHSFEPIKMLQWRNADLEFTSIGTLQASLADTPKEPGLTRAPIGEDILVLDHAARDDEIRVLATSRDAVERLWDVCQIPDYRKISPATHAELATTVYAFLMREGRIPTDWFARQVNDADHPEGDIDTLSNRIAHIRTWTFAANRPDWLADPEHWQGVTRAVEDKLSDALHERLTERFVDRRTSVLMRRLRENTSLDTDISKSGEVVVEGHTIGRLDGFMFTPDASNAGSDAKALAGAAQKALAGEIDARATRLSQAADGQFVLSTDDTIRWIGQPVGKLVAGESVLKPRVRIIADEHLTGAPRDAVQARLDLWLKSHIERLLETLFRLSAAEDVTGIARGIAFQLSESLGVLDRQQVAEEVKGLDQPARATLRKYGVRFGAYHIYVPALLKPAPRVLATQLFALKHSGPDTKGIEPVEQLARSGRTSIAADKDIPKLLYRTAGYRVCGERAVRVDILERLADLIRPALAWRSGSPGVRPPGAIDGFGFTVTVGMTSLAGCSGENFASVLRSLGYRMEKRPKPVETSVEPPTRPAPAAMSSEQVSSEQVPSEPVSSEQVASEQATPADVVPSETNETGLAAAAAEGETGPQASSPEAADATPTAPAIQPAVEAAAIVPDEPAAAETPPAAEGVISVPDAPTLSLAAPAEQAAEGHDASGSADQAAQPPAPEPEPSATAGMNAEDAAKPAADAAAKSQTDEKPSTEEFIEVWRPGRRENHQPRRPRHERGAQARRPQRPRDAAAVAGTADGGPATATDAAAVPAAADASSGPHEHRRRDHRHEERRHERSERPERHQRADRPGEERHRRGGRPERGDYQQRGKPRGDRPDRPPREDRPDRDPVLRAQYIKGRGDGRDRRDKEPDPNSPFAKLAALKEQLEANTKEPR